MLADNIGLTHDQLSKAFSIVSIEDTQQRGINGDVKITIIVEVCNGDPFKR